MAAPRRIEKVNGVIREVLAKIIEREIDLPAVTLLTITRVEASPDLHSATVFVTVYPSDAGRVRAVIQTLSRASGVIQRSLNRSLRIRPVPKITFRLDRAEANRERVEELLAREPPSN